MTNVLMEWVCHHCGTVTIVFQPTITGVQTFTAPVCHCGRNYTFHGMEIVDANS